MCAMVRFTARRGFYISRASRGHSRRNCTKGEGDCDRVPADLEVNPHQSLTNDATVWVLVTVLVDVAHNY